MTFPEYINFNFSKSLKEELKCSSFLIWPPSKEGVRERLTEELSRRILLSEIGDGFVPIGFGPLYPQFCYRLQRRSGEELARDLRNPNHRTGLICLRWMLDPAHSSESFLAVSLRTYKFAYIGGLQLFDNSIGYRGDLFYVSTVGSKSFELLEEFYEDKLEAWRHRPSLEPLIPVREDF